MIFEILLSKTFQLDFNLWNEYIKDVLASDIRWLELRSLEILDTFQTLTSEEERGGG